MEYRRIIAVIIALFWLLSGSLALALEPPAPGEIAQLKETGELPARLEAAKALGNHRIDSFLLEKALVKSTRKALAQQGLAAEKIALAAPLPAPPSGWAGMPTSGTGKMFVLLIDFSDYPAYNTTAAINSSLFGDGTLIPSNPAPYESLTSYYKRSSYGLLDLSGGVTLGWFRPAYTRATMAMTTTARETLIKEAITYFKGLGQDFSQFDNNGDGTIDYFAVIWTGPNNGWANFWWGYQTSFSDASFTMDGKKLGKYSWQWEYNSAGVYAGPFSPKTIIHETGHALGLPDYYDYDGTVGPNGGVGSLDMMDGNWGDHNCFSKWVLDWLPPTIVASGSQSPTLNPSGTFPEAVMIMPNAASGDPFREFFIAQNRYRTGNDLNYPTDGMLVWHVDARLNGTGSDYLYNNSYTSHKLLKLMQADGLDRIENSFATVDAAMYYQPGKTMTPLSNPSSKDYAGLDSRVNVTGITQAWPQMSASFHIDAASALSTLSVLKTGMGSGTVSSIPAGIACGDDCGEAYAPGSSVTLTGVADPGSRLTGWSGGGCSGSSNTCQPNLATNATVTANFFSNLLLNENFDAKILPAGWTIVNTTGSNWWFLSTAGYGNTGGSGGFALGATSNYQTSYDIELRTPSLDLSGYANIGLEFKSDISNSGATSDVDISVNGSAGPWTNLWKKTGSFPGPTTVKLDLSATGAGNGNVMLRFHHYGTALKWLIDDVKVMATATGLPGAPTNVAAVGGNGQATVSFTAPGTTGGSAITGYTVTANPPGGVDQNAGTPTTSHLVTGLINGTEYTFTVTATTAAGTSLPSLPSNSVVAGQLTALSENFDAVTVPGLPTGWQVALASGPGSPNWLTHVATVHPSGVAAHSGANLVYLNSYTFPNNSTASLVSPPFSLVGITNAKVTFWIYREHGYATCDDLVNVYLNTSIATSGASLLGTSHRVYLPAGWYKYEFTIPASYTGDTNYLIFKGIGQYGNDLHLDDITVTGLPPDNTPPTTTAAATGYTFNSWTNNPAVSVTLSAGDGSGTGVAPGYPKYCVDTGNLCLPSTSYTTPFTVNCPPGSVCTSYLRYQALDNAGNSETVQSALVKQDLAGPETSANPAGGSYTSPQSVALTCDDHGGSGCAGITYCTGAACSPTTDYGGLISIASSTILIYRAIDVAGNSETVQEASYTIMIDSDGDGVVDSVDNCPTTSNPNQKDANTNGIGDACDFASDSDNDGVSDGQEVLNGTDPLVSDNGSFNPTGDFISGSLLDPAVNTPGSQLTMRQLLSFNGTVAGSYDILAASGGGSGATGMIRLLPNPDHTFSVANSEVTGITANDQSIMVSADANKGDNKLGLEISGRKGSGLGNGSLNGDHVFSALHNTTVSTTPTMLTRRLALHFDGSGGVDYTTLADSAGGSGSGIGAYSVLTDGTLDLLGGTGFVTPDGEVIMVVDTTVNADPAVDDDISLGVGVRRGANMRNANLHGEFVYYEMGYEALTWTSRSVYTFNGKGGATMVRTADSDGQTFTTPERLSYDVAGDGTVSIGGQVAGVLSANGQYLILADTDGHDGSPGIFLGIGVKTAKVVPEQLGLFRQGNWYLDLNNNGHWDAGSDETTAFGLLAGDKPVVGDWNGDGFSKRGIYRGGTWYLDINGNGKWDGAPTDKLIVGFGIATDVPVAGDWNGDGITEIGYYRPSTNNWYLDWNGDGVFTPGLDQQTRFGQPGDLPVVGDWTGSGVDRIGLYRTNSGAGNWYLDINGNGAWDSSSDRQVKFGQPGDQPVPGDWAGTGVDLLGLYRQGTWYLDLNGSGSWNGTPTDKIMGKFGQPTDIAVVGKW